MYRYSVVHGEARQSRYMTPVCHATTQLVALCTIPLLPFEHLSILSNIFCDSFRFHPAERYLYHFLQGVYTSLINLFHTASMCSKLIYDILLINNICDHMHCIVLTYPASNIKKSWLTNYEYFCVTNITPSAGTTDRRSEVLMAAGNKHGCLLDCSTVCYVRCLMTY